jgi:hypothetical protein
MKHLTPLLRPFLLLALVALLPAGLDAQPGRWERLGLRKVNFGLDRDEIFVTASEGTFTSLKFIVRGAPINMRRCVVHFRNGDTQELELRNNIPAGGESRVLDLAGNRRVITKVVFWYDTKDAALPRGRATLELWGR